MALTVTIGGTARSLIHGSLEVSASLGARGTARLAYLSRDRTGRPALDDAVVIAKDATTVFAGLVTQITEEAAGVNGIELTVEASDYQCYADRRLVTATIAAGQTVKQVLTTLVAYLSTYGVTLHASQADGASLDAITWETKVLTDCLADLAAITGWVWTIDASKYLRMWSPGTIAAPWNMSDASPYAETVTVDTSRLNYANRQYVRAGTDKAVWTEDIFTADGATRTWQMVYPCLVKPNWVGKNVYIVGDGDHWMRPLGIYGVDSTEWTFDSSTTPPTIRQDAGYDIIPNGSQVSWPYDAIFPITVQANDAAEQAAHGLFEAIADAPDVFDNDQAEALAAGLLARAAADRQVVTWKTYDTGLGIGQSIGIVLTLRNLNGTYLITDVSGVDQAGADLIWTVKAESGNAYRGSALDTYRLWSRGTGAVISGSGAVLTSTGHERVDLGGSRIIGQASASFADVPEYRDVWLDSGTYGSRSVTLMVDVKTRNTGTGVTAELWNVTDSSQAAVTTAYSTDTNWSAQTATVTLASGLKRYRLRVKGANANADVFAIGAVDIN